MSFNRLLLELKKGDFLSFTIRGNDEIIGKIKIDEKSWFESANLVLEFIPEITIVRDSAKSKFKKL